ncbi:MAG: PAS domain S-box protein, partial [Burkholderiales bacterium]|nr:PAS domain S-box protein [Burkholderiales bacterium]
YDLNRFMEQTVPWWFIQRYDLGLMEADGHLVVLHDGSLPSDIDRAQTISFGPPGSGLMLKVSRHDRDSWWAVIGALALVIVLLGVLVVYLLRVLQRWLQQRIDAQRALSDELRFREAMENSTATGLVAFDLQGRIIYVNPAFCRLVGLSAQQLVSLEAPFPFWLPERQAACEAAHQAMLRGEVKSEGESMHFRRADSAPLIVNAYTSLLVDGRGTARGWMASFYDTTAERQAAEAARERDALLQQTVKLTSLAEFASGIAHELNQPLAAIANYSAVVESCLEASPAQATVAAEAAARIGDEARRAGHIIRSLRSASQKQAAQSSPRDLLQLLDEPLALLSPLIERKNVAVQIVAGNAPTIVECDAVMIEQVLLNLIRNALEALEHEPADMPADAVVVHIRHDDDGVTVSVADRGPGVSQPDKLFRAFHTTKPDGMGLGLAICRTVMERHGGRLWMEDNPGGGAVFSFRLPLSLLVVPETTP